MTCRIEFLTILFRRDALRALMGKEVKLMNGDDESVTMKDGRVMTMRGGNLAPLEEDITLSDGTRVQADGTVVMTDGSRRVLMEGETLYMSGRVMDMANKPDEPPDLNRTQTPDPGQDTPNR